MGNIHPNLLTGMGAAVSVFLAGAGAAMATAHAGLYALRAKPHFGSLALVPCMQSGVLALYGIAISTMLALQMGPDNTEEAGYRFLAAGLSVGLTSWASGWGISKYMKMINQEKSTGTATTSGTSTDDNSITEPLLPQPTTGATLPPAPKDVILPLIFLECIGLYGLVASLVLITRK